MQGHQDKHTPFESLSRPAQLNVIADALATRARHTSHSDDQLSTVAFPSCPAYLLNEGQIQSSQEMQPLRWKWSDFNLEDYYKGRLQMPKSVLRRINWQAYRISRRRLSPAEQTFATKILTRWLPTGKRIEKYGATATACHRCGDDETVDHLFQCPANKKWANDFLTRLEKFLQDNNTELDMQKALIAGIQNWLSPGIDQQRAPFAMKEHMRLQREIGWNLTFCGLFDENWCCIQEQHLYMQDNSETGMVWSVKLCIWMIREAWQAWQSRNEEVHKPDDGKSKAEMAIHEQIRKLYELRDDIGHHDRVILDEPIEDKLRRPFPVLQQWVRNTVPAINRCISDFQKKLRTGQRGIRQYLQRQQPVLSNSVTSQSESTIPE